MYNKKKKKSGLQKTITVFVWIMIILTLGSVLYGTFSALPTLGL